MQDCTIKSHRLHHRSSKHCHRVNRCVCQPFCTHRPSFRTQHSQTRVRFPLISWGCSTALDSMKWMLWITKFLSPGPFNTHSAVPLSHQGTPPERCWAPRQRHDQSFLTPGYIVSFWSRVVASYWRQCHIHPSQRCSQASTSCLFWTMLVIQVSVLAQM